MNEEAKGLGHRILIKISGEALNGSGDSIYDKRCLDNVCEMIKPIINKNIQIAIVIGAGNLLRGRDSEKWDIKRPDADEMGIIFTVANALMLRNRLKTYDIHAVVMTPMVIGGSTKLFNRYDAIEKLNNGEVVIFGGGIGNPFVSTDYPAVQKAIEIESDILYMAKNIDAVYDSDPKINNDAKRYKKISYQTCLEKNINVCDTAAFVLAKEFGIDMHLYDGKEKNALVRIIDGESIGTIVSANVEDIIY